MLGLILWVDTGTVGPVEVAVVVVAGLLFKGSPTAISQRCPGCPCAGFIPGAVLVAVGTTVGVVVVITGD
jgi:hypothetical protein